MTSVDNRIARLDTFLRRTLEKLSTTEEQDIEAFVDQYSGGREKLRQDDKALKRLYDMELGYKQPNSQLNPLSDISTSKNSRPILNVPSALDKLKEDLKETVTESIEKSLIIFIPKLHIEMQRVEAGLTRTVERTGDRVITALSRGPHELLTNQVRVLCSGSRFIITHLCSILRICIRFGVSWYSSSRHSTFKCVLTSVQRSGVACQRQVWTFRTRSPRLLPKWIINSQACPRYPFAPGCTDGQCSLVRRSCHGHCHQRR